MCQHYTPNEFNQLPAPVKYAAIEDKGTYLDAYYLSGPYKIALFALYGYYVEVWLDQSKDKLIKAVAFASYKKLDPFLHSVDIMPLYSVL